MTAYDVATSNDFRNACADAGPGDEIVLQDGDYDDAKVWEGGMAAAPLRIVARNPGRAILRGPLQALDIDSRRNFGKLSGQPHVVVEGLRFAGAFASKHCLLASHYWTIRGCSFDNLMFSNKIEPGAAAFQAFGDHVTVEFCRFTDIETDQPRRKASPHAFYGDFTDDLTFRSCEVRNIDTFNRNTNVSYSCTSKVLHIRGLLMEDMVYENTHCGPWLDFDVEDAVLRRIRARNLRTSGDKAWQTGGVYIEANDFPKGRPFPNILIEDCDLESPHTAAALPESSGVLLRHCRLAGAIGVRFRDADRHDERKRNFDIQILDNIIDAPLALADGRAGSWAWIAGPTPQDQEILFDGNSYPRETRFQYVGQEYDLTAWRALGQDNSPSPADVGPRT